MKGVLIYNELKVAAGKAVMLEARGYHKDTEKLDFQDKLFRLQDLAGRNQRVRTNTVHISLNFDVGEKVPPEMAMAVADRYMEGIGFSAQPYLIYEHFDAGHPHLHIVSTNIDRDGQRISLHNLGKTKSETTRKAIELEFGLIKAEAVKVAAQAKLEPVHYGETDSKRAVANIVNSVLRDYRFTSLPEFNAALQRYHVLADQGSKSSVMFKHNGLRYWILDNAGKKLGVPLKASSLPGKPVMKLLQRRFLLNKTLRAPQKEVVRSKVGRALAKSDSLAALQKVLAKQDIQTVIRRTDAGLIYGLTFVDHDLKVVFKGSDLDKAYSAAGITAQFGSEPARKEVHEQAQQVSSAANPLLEALFAPSPDEAAVPGELRRKKKKKRRLNL